MRKASSIFKKALENSSKSNSNNSKKRLLRLEALENREFLAASSLLAACAGAEAAAVVAAPDPDASATAVFADSQDAAANAIVLEGAGVEDTNVEPVANASGTYDANASGTCRITDAEYAATIYFNITPASAKKGAKYQWYQVDSAGNAKAISGATNYYYKVRDVDVGCSLKCIATLNGAYSGKKVTLVTNVIANPEIEKISLSTNGPVYGKTVSVAIIPSAARATATYQWYR
ncbi:MAG: hypothetical protein HUK22_01370, partial [Thermoguttaceae bacterium]|nr:hypothetical protein [Thermoguttaceae bacterium]